MTVSMGDILEKDWKYARSIKEKAVNLACGRILNKILAITRSDNTNHEKFLNIWDVLQAENDEIAVMFDGFRRSTAIFQISLWKKNGLITDEEFSSFSSETQDIIKRISEIQR